jgi:isoamylase
VFRRRRFFDGLPVGRRGRKGLPDIAWLRPDGSQMTKQDWGSGFGRAVAVFLNGQGIADRDGRGERVVDDSFVLCFSAHHEHIQFMLPPASYGRNWQVVLDTMNPDVGDEQVLRYRQRVDVGPRALVVLQRID